MENSQKQLKLVLTQSSFWNDRWGHKQGSRYVGQPSSYDDDRGCGLMDQKEKDDSPWSDHLSRVNPSVNSKVTKKKLIVYIVKVLSDPEDF